jgi:hypothetical protein
MHTNVLLKDFKGTDYLENLGIDGKIILEWILEKYDGKLWTGLTWIRAGTTGRQGIS